jgi:hypothetical protein
VINQLVINAGGVSLFQVSRVGGYAEEIIKALTYVVWKARSKKLSNPNAGSMIELILDISNLDINCSSCHTICCPIFDLTSSAKPTRD